MEIETMVKELPIDENLQKNIAALEADGWGLVPGVVPMAVYHLVRAKQEPAQQHGAQGVMHLRDDLIFVQPAQQPQQG